MSAATLFDLTGRAAALANRIEAIAADLLDDDADRASIYAELEELITAAADNRDELNAKADAWCWVISQLHARAEARKAKADQLKQLAMADERQAEILTSRLVAALAQVDPSSTRHDFGINGLRSRKSTAVQIDPGIEPEDLPEIYQRRVTTVSFNKELMAKELRKAGAGIEGVRLVERVSWRIV